MENKSHLNEQGFEILDDTPIAVPVGFTTRPLSLQERLAQFDPRTRQNIWNDLEGDDEDLPFDDEDYEPDEPPSPAELRHYDSLINPKAPAEAPVAPAEAPTTTE